MNLLESYLVFSFSKEKEKERENVLVRHKDLPAGHNLSERNGTIIAPFLGRCHVIDEDDKVVGLALVEDLGDVVVSARHDGGGWMVWVFVECL